jgi:hypothetical protein
MAFNHILPKTLGQLRQYFDSNFVVKDMGYATPCYIWKGKPSSAGYGVLGWGHSKKKYYAHRMSWFLNFGVHSEKWVLHKCDVRNCVRIDHLFEGTALDNSRDMFSKGRNGHLKGEACPAAKLKESDVLEMRKKRANGRSVRSLSTEYSTPIGTVSSVCSGKTWKHVGGPLTNRPINLSDSERKEILYLWFSGKYSQSSLGNMFNVCQSAISRLVKKSYAV